MTLEEAIKLLKQYQGYDPMFPDGETLKHAFDLTDETVDTLLTALRPVSREQMEKVWKGEWLHPHWHNSESCADCSRCNADVGHREFRGVQTEYNFCPVCGAAQNDKAVDMVMERLEEMRNG